MSGFFLMQIKQNQDRSSELSQLMKAYAELGFSNPEIVECSGYIFVAYPSLVTKTIALRRYSNGDFVFVCGTCINDQGVGIAAADLVYRQKIEPDVNHEIFGHYAIVIRCGASTEIVLDRFGGYHIFYSSEKAIISTSFYSLSLALDRLTLSRQSAYEYAFNGVVSGNDTIFDEISLAPIGATIRVDHPGFDIARPKLGVTRNYTLASRAASLENSMMLLDRYFDPIARTFGDRVGCALSGGYDSRLLLACMRRHGIKPRVFVYGHGAERDVRFASEIAEQEGFPLAIIDKDNQKTIVPEEFPITAHRNFLAQDGYGWAGIFQNNAEIAESQRRVEGNLIAFNGGGGEIFRNFFYLLHRRYSVRELLWSFYSGFDPAICTTAFDSGCYYRKLERKIADILGSDEVLLPRPTVEWLYHTFRCRSWDGRVNSICGRYGYTAMPYLERAITEHASALRLCWKNHGAYEAELIRRADRKLSEYPSIYGHNFAGPPPMSRRISDYSTYLRPPWLRRYTYRLKHRHGRSGNWPGYLAEPYRTATLPGGSVYVHRLFHLERVFDAEQFARILSLEYALRHFGSRVRF